MPNIIKDYIWKQTEDTITIEVPLKGVHQSKVEVFTSARYIKAIFEKNFFEVILLHPIDISASKCTLTPTHIVYELKKCEVTNWESLEPNITKAEKLELKKKLLNEAYVQIQKENEEKECKKSELKRVAVREQIERDTRNRQHIDDIKKKEEATALGDINEWRESLPALSHKEEKTCKKPSTGKPKIKKNCYKSRPPSPPPGELKEEKEPEPIPMPRVTKSLQIDFTERHFPTPSRESKLDEENEWLKKQAEARRSAGFISEDIRPEERNPQFLKAKGDEFMKNKNYLGALSAYSFGIKLSDKFVDLYIARSEAHLAVGNHHKTIQDCTTALELLKPALPVNLKERALCIGRRGKALCKIGMLKQGIDELEFSIRLVPDKHFEDVQDKAEDELEKKNSNY